MVIRRLTCITAVALASIFACSVRADATDRNWAAPEIRTVTKAGVLGHSPATFAPQAPLTQSALAAAIAATAALQHPLAPPTPPAPPPTIESTVGPGDLVAGDVSVTVDAPGQTIDHVDFAVDGVGVDSEDSDPVRVPARHADAGRRRAPARRQRLVRRRRHRGRGLERHGRKRRTLGAAAARGARRGAGREVIPADARAGADDRRSRLAFSTTPWRRRKRSPSSNSMQRSSAISASATRRGRSRERSRRRGCTRARAPAPKRSRACSGSA